ncbi:uncharacterized protein [Aegilops tauschii subsp. strangulata]|uniref:uncharacterized protein n=1 Tax=Aegilops tauschii subsp. strangulata TaxID=200361 RepID=UPI003CC8A4E4
MKEELAIHEELCMALELFNLATKCARAEEGRLSLLELPATDLEEKKAKAKDVKRKGVAVLAAEPDTKRGRDNPESSKSSRLFCAFHNVHNHNTNDCQELTAIRDGCLGRRPERNDRGYGRGGGRGRGCWDDRGPRQEWRDRPSEDRWQDQPREGAWRDQPREDRPQGNAGLPPLPPPPRRNDDHHHDEGAGGFQEPRAIACILGGAQAPASQRIFKQVAREVNAALPRLEATCMLMWSKCAITFSSADQLKCAATAGALPMLCSPVISNVQVTKTLIDGGAGLNVLSVETFDNLQVPYDQLQPTKRFSGVTDDSTTPMGQVRLPVTFGQRDNYRTELIDFDIVHIRLPYNAILGYPALAKFMAVTHHGYNVLKMPGGGGIITVPCEERGAVCSLERAFQAQRSKTPTTMVRSTVLRPSPRRKSSYSAQGLSGAASLVVQHPDWRPRLGRLPPSHRKARPAPSSGRARGLSSGGPQT